VISNVLSLSLLRRKQGHCHGFGWGEEEKKKEQTQYLSVLALTADDIILIRDTRPPVRVRGSAGLLGSTKLTWLIITKANKMTTQKRSCLFGKERQKLDTKIRKKGSAGTIT